MTERKPIHITRKEAERRLTKIVDQAEEKYGQGCGYRDVDEPFCRTHMSCRYFDPSGQPMCLIGRLLATYRITQEDLNSANRKDYSISRNEYSITCLADKLTWLTFGPGALDHLSGVQSRQDEGMSWRGCLAED
ncbi:MAG: hypothetical protein ACRD0W_09835 [Acidimicrobiales bacterium]